MVEMKAVYTGAKHVQLSHGPSGASIETDAPRDNQGLGANFSPTDLIGAALASCALTTMALLAEKLGLHINGARARVCKEMQSAPRRIAKLPLEIEMPPGIRAEDRPQLEEAARNCPVKRSLSGDIETSIRFVYPS